MVNTMENSDEEAIDDLLEPEDLFNEEAEEAFDDHNENAEEKPKEEKAEKKIKQPRVVKKTKKIPSYDILNGDNGLSALKKLFKNFKFKGNSHEEEDLTKIMGILQQWICYQFCPQYDFESGMLELENLGKKRIIQVLMKKFRLGMDKWGEDKPENSLEEMTENLNEFDLLMNEEMANVRTDDEMCDNDTPKEPEVTLTQAQLERIAKNRKLAEERRLQRMSEHQSVEVERSNEQEISLDGITLKENC